MVTFRLIEETEDYLVYWYFPDGHEDEKYGIILLNKLNKTIQIPKLADNIWSMAARLFNWSAKGFEHRLKSNGSYDLF